jgi:Saccharopine dehydrogenase NADP binding domain
MQPYRVLVIGGHGFFGSRIVERLSRRAGLQVVAAGRSQKQGQRLAESLGPSVLSHVSSVALDVRGPELAPQLRALAPQVVVSTAGPFQGQQYAVARACIAAGAHYIDLADGREFVAGIRSLDLEARAARLAVISGASSVPALSSAVADHLAHGLTRVDRIDIGISPGNRTERGLATVQAILGYCGKRLPASASASASANANANANEAAAAPSFGWSGSRRHPYPAPVGSRLLSPCDVPDLTLLPNRYPGNPSVSFGAGLELQLLHRGMNAMAMLTRLGIVPDWSKHAMALKRAADWFKALGSDAGAMHVTVTGHTAEGLTRTRTWHLIATHGDGPYVPTLAATALVHKLQLGDTALAGAQPCVGVLTLEDFRRETDGLRIEMTEVST